MDKDLKRKSASSGSSGDETKEESPTKKVKTDVDEKLTFIQKISKRRTDICASVAKFKFNKKRVRVLSEAEDFEDGSKGVVYWMSRDQRVQDNWAFLYAQRLALKLELPLHVVFCLLPKCLDETIRQVGFMLKGLAEIEKECTKLNISFHLLLGEPQSVLPKFVKANNMGGVVTDFSPLRLPISWLEAVKKNLPDGVPFCQVDAHNIVPCWEASPKLEYSARTIRSKIHNVLQGYLTEFPPVCKHPHKAKTTAQAVDWEGAHKFVEVDRSVDEVEWAKAGTEGGLAMLESFCIDRLRYFSSQRNNPNKPALSNLSPWIRYGHVSVQRCILTVKLYRSKSSEGVNAFIEEAIIRRELADNFCFYNQEHYDSIKGAYKWAQDTLEAHKGDKRPHLYSRQQLENAQTHDDLWNAAQRQMVREGKMHGFLRMYWAKKILEWTESPEVALKDALYLNDRYNLDGRDPNGYVGCMWSICGIHDQGWGERAIFGKIRFMNYDGCKRKFDVADFVRKYRK